MSRSLSLWIFACLGVLPLAAFAQNMDMQDMPGMAMPSAHDHHNAVPAKDDAQHAGMDHAGHDMSGHYMDKTCLLYTSPSPRDS